jgi:cation:H+ antiporter
MDLVILAIAFAVILIGAELFTNGIEWFGHKLNLAEGAVGSVLAAVGTALPETMIPLVAILSAVVMGQSAEDSHAVAVGAVLGAPFMLSTLAMLITGIAVVVRARRRGTDEMPVNTSVLGKDVLYFFVSYGIAVGAAFLPPDADLLRLGAAVILLVAYAIYVREHFKEEGESEASDLAPLRFGRLDAEAHRELPHGPRMRIVSLQVIAALALIVVGAVAFVDGVSRLSQSLGVAPVILSLVIAPIATELPEKFNSLIWIRSGKDTLAIGNITGAMVFQSCIPTFVALLFAADAWHVVPGNTESNLAFVSAGIAFLSTAAIFIPMWRAGRLRGRLLLIGGLFYVVYLALVVATL